jgi:hypothetical protein
MRHTSASLVILLGNADPDVRIRNRSSTRADANWVHDVEGPDDMPAHEGHAHGRFAACARYDGALASAPGRAFMSPSTGSGRTGARLCRRYWQQR